jgi:hypothetical protein
MVLVGSGTTDAERHLAVCDQTKGCANISPRVLIESMEKSKCDRKRNMHKEFVLEFHSQFP